jgi:hypothetical protein
MPSSKVLWWLSHWNPPPIERFVVAAYRRVPDYVERLLEQERWT